MGMKEKPRMVHKSMQGKEVDMHKISMQNEMTIAVGNARVNARGDELGPGGKIIRKREDVIREAATSRPNQVLTPEEPVIENSVTEQPVKTKTTRKNIDDMDPEGNE